MGDWFNAAQQQYDSEVPSYLEDEPEFDEQYCSRDDFDQKDAE